MWAEWEWDQVGLVESELGWVKTCFTVWGRMGFCWIWLGDVGWSTISCKCWLQSQQSLSSSSFPQPSYIHVSSDSHPTSFHPISCSAPLNATYTPAMAVVAEGNQPFTILPSYSSSPFRSSLHLFWFLSSHPPLFLSIFTVFCSCSHWSGLSTYSLIDSQAGEAITNFLTGKIYQPTEVNRPFRFTVYHHQPPKAVTASGVVFFFSDSAKSTTTEGFCSDFIIHLRRPSESFLVCFNIWDWMTFCNRLCDWNLRLHLFRFTHEIGSEGIRHISSDQHVDLRYYHQRKFTIHYIQF